MVGLKKQWNLFLNWLIPGRRSRILSEIMKKDQELGLYNEQCCGLWDDLGRCKCSKMDLEQPQQLLDYQSADLVEENYSPYCPICSACGVEGCCSPLSCQQHHNGDYCSGYLTDLKFGYDMNCWFVNELLETLPEEAQEKYNKMWNQLYDIHYNQQDV